MSNSISKIPSIVYEPYTKAVIRNCVRVSSVEKFAVLARALESDSQPFLLWAHGILFDCTTGEGEYAEMQRLKGVAYFIFVFYCEYPTYRPVIATPYGDILVIDCSSDPLYGTIAAWIKREGQSYALA